jgi:hypothetical protein
MKNSTMFRTGLVLIEKVRNKKGENRIRGFPDESLNTVISKCGGWTIAGANERRQKVRALQSGEEKGAGVRIQMISLL